MILAQKNIFEFYTGLDDRQWDTTENKYNAIVVLPRYTVPSIQLFVDVATAATLDLCNSEGEVLDSIDSMVVEAETGYVRLKYISDQYDGDADEGYFCLKITTSEEVFYSDVFEWRTDVTLSGLIKITASSSNFSLGIDKEYLYDTTNFTFECYLKVFDYPGLSTETEELARDANGVLFPYYTGTAISESWIINGNKHIYRFLSILRLLQQNGVVTILWEGTTRTANDIMDEISVDHGYYDLVDIELKIKASGDVVTVINKTN